MPSRRVVLAGCVVVAAGLVASLLLRLHTPYAYPGCTPEQVDVFRLLDRFFPPDLPGQPFVEVARLGRPGLEPRWRWRRHGFLLDDRGGRIRVRYLAGECVVLERDWLWHFTATPADLGAHAGELAAQAARGAEERGDTDEPMSAATRALVAARALARAGRMPELDRVWQRLPERLRSAEQLLAVERFREDVVNRVALDVGDLAMSWAELLDRNEDLLACVMSTEGKRDIDALVAVVAAHRAAGDAPTVRDDLREALRPRGWNWDTMYLLRWEPAVPDGFDRVLARGLTAVPELIALLDDGSPTRSVGYSTRKRFGIGQATVGDVAHEALGVLFAHHPRDFEVDYPGLYSHVRQVGHRQYLAARMRSDGEGYVAAASYLRFWPDDVGAVLAAARDVDVGRRFSLLQALPDAATSQPAVRPTFVELVHSVASEGEPGHRADAAWQLLRVGDDFGVRLLRTRWLEGDPLDVPTCGVVLGAGLPEAWHELLPRLEESPVRAMFASFVDTTRLRDLLQHAAAADRTRIEVAVRKCLMRLLADASPAAHQLPKVRRQYVSGVERAYRATNGDSAALALASWWPAEFHYDVRCTTTVRRRQIDAMLRANGLPAPPAEPREPGHGPDEIGVIRFAAGANALRDDVQAQLRVLEHTEFDARKVATALRAFAASCDGTVLLHLERTGDGDGWSAICEANGGSEVRNVARDVRLCESVGSTSHAQDADEPYEAPRDGAVELTFLVQIY